MSDFSMANSELILGGQKSGKSRRAELLAHDWLAKSPSHGAVLIATAKPWDDEMQGRIARHQQDRAIRVPGLKTIEEPLDLAGTIASQSAPGTLLVIDCLTLWLTNLLMPANSAMAPGVPEEPSRWGDPEDPRFAVDRPVRAHPATIAQAHISGLVAAIGAAPGPLVFVGNEIGLGVIPMGREVRAFVDTLGLLNQQVAAACERVVLMAAGLPLVLKAQDGGTKRP